MPIQKLETNNVLKEWLDTINAMIDNNDVIEETIDNKVDKVTGKGLSTEDFTTALKTKLESVEEGANKYVLSTATDTIVGGVSLSDSTSSEASVFDGVAATPKAVKIAYDLASAALSTEGGVIKGDLTVEGKINAVISGNAETATKLATPATIVLSGDATGSCSFDGSDTVIEITVVDDSHNHTIDNIDNLTATLSAKAAVASPTFSGTPKAPTAKAGTNSTQIATTAFVNNAIDSKIAASDAMIFKGTLGTNGTVQALPDTHSTGWTYKVVTEGTYAGIKCNVGDMIVCLTDGTASSDADWTVIEGNIDGAVTGPASSVSGNIAVFDGATGKVVKDSGFTIASDVPANAVFTDTTYTGSDGITLNGTNFSNSGVRSVSSGSANGTISVNTNGTSTDVKVAGLGSAAYTESTAYAPTSHTSVNANGSVLGHVYLTDSVESEYDVDDKYAATPKAVKTAYDLAAEAKGLFESGKFDSIEVNTITVPNGGEIDKVFIDESSATFKYQGVGNDFPAIVTIDGDGITIQEEEGQEGTTTISAWDINVPRLSAGTVEIAPYEHHGPALVIGETIHFGASYPITSDDTLELDSDVHVSGDLTVDGVINAAISGNAESATKLTEAKTILLTGDVEGQVAFDGSEDVTINVTVVDDSHNHTIDNIDNLTTTLASKANVTSPELKGVPTAPTPTAGDSTDKIATTAFVANAIADDVAGPASAVDGNIAVFNGTTGKSVKDSGFTIASSVPAGAKFTDTTYNVVTDDTDGLMSSEMFVKLSEIEEGAQANTPAFSAIYLHDIKDELYETYEAANFDNQITLYAGNGIKGWRWAPDGLDFDGIRFDISSDYFTSSDNSITISGGDVYFDMSDTEWKSRPLDLVANVNLTEFEKVISPEVIIPNEDEDYNAVEITKDSASYIYTARGADFALTTDIDGHGIMISSDHNTDSGQSPTHIDNVSVSTEVLQTNELHARTYNTGASISVTSDLNASGYNITAAKFTGALDGTAYKATADASGNVFTTTYATKTELNAKANTSDVVALSGNQTIAGTKTFSSTITGSISGNAGTATKLAESKTIALSGDATGSVSFDGSQDVTLTIAIADDSHNHTIDNIDNLETTLASKANVTSPELKGVPTAPTAASTTNTTQIATTAFVQAVVDAKIAAADAMIYKGTIGSGGTVTTLPAEHKTGWTYKVITAGTYAGVKCNVGDMIVCLTDGTAANNAHWSVIEGNIDGAVTGPASAVSGQVAVFDGTTGKVIKDSGFTIAKSVPSNAVFTDTTYTVGTTSYSGTTKLYTSTGSNTDGTITQKVITDTFLTKQAFEDYKDSEEVAEAKETSWSNDTAITQNSTVTIPNGVLYPYGKNALIVSVDGIVLSKGVNYEEVGTDGEFSNQIKFLFDIEANSLIKVWVSAQALVYGSWDFIQNSVETTHENVELCRQYTENVDMTKKADIASPTFTGIPAAPTASVGTNTTQIATTAFVNSTINNILSKGIFSNVIALSGTQIDVSLGSCFTKTISAATAFTITGCESGKSAIFTLVLTNGGSKTVTWDSSIKWADEEVPELTSSGVDILTFITVDGGTTWYGTPSVINAL